MKKLLKRIIPIILCLSLVFTVAPVRAEYTPPTTTVKIGLDYGSGALQASYLEAEDGYGDGFRFGYYNDREFVPIGQTSCTDVVVLRDVNMYESGGRYSTTVNSGSKTVGCYHIQIDKEYPSYNDAKAAADTFTSVDAFVKFADGKYYVCAGDYTSSSAASSAASKLNIASDYFITSGSKYTVVLVHTSTGKILFEFEWGTTYYLGVEPFCNDGTKPQTWHAGYLYHGGFRFGRQTGGDVFCINVVDIEDYLKGVVPYEMSASWPREALKAQAVCARSYVMGSLNKHGSNDFDICDAADCQVYSGLGRATSNSNAAVEETAGKYMLYDGELCISYYYSSNGGASESSQNVWYDTIGYLQGVVDPYEADIADSVSNYYWSYTFTGDQLASELRAAGYSCSRIVKFYVSEYTPTGNVYSLTFVDSTGKTITILRRNCCTVLGLRSQRFKVYNKASNGELIDTSAAVKPVIVNDGQSINGSLGQYYGIGGSGTVSKFGSDTLYAITGDGSTVTVGDEKGTIPEPVSNTFVINGSGWGHNVGMSQWGAYSMAKYHDKTYDEILKFYFTGVTIE